MAASSVRWGLAVVGLGLGGGLGCGGVEPGTTAASDGEATVAGGTGADSGADADSGGSSTTWMLPDPDGSADGPPMPSQSAACARYVACVTELREELDGIEPMYGAGGTCWQGDATQAAACDDACGVELAALVMALEEQGQGVPQVCDPPREVPWAEIEAIVAASCVAGCHEPGGEDPSLDLSDGPYYAIHGVASEQSTLYLVQAGSHEESYLWHKVNGSQGSVGGGGTRMPKGAAALTGEQIEAMADWIDGGASMF